MDDLDASSAPREHARHAWVIGGVALIWLGLHVAGLVAGGGRLESDHVLTWGAVPQEVLVRHGALVPARVTGGEWQRLLTGSAVAGQGVLALVLALWILLGAGRTVERLAGSARTLTVVTLAALAGGVARVLFVPESRMPHVAGWDLVMGCVGAQIPLGLAIGGRPGRTLVSGALAFVALSALLTFALPGTPTSHLLGEGVGLATGVLVMALLGPRRAALPPGPLARGLAFLCLALVLGAAGWQVKGAVGGTDDAALRRLVSAVRAADLAGQQYAKRPSDDALATLRGRLEAARAAADLKGLDGASELDAYLDLMDTLASFERPDPVSLRGRLRAAYEAWAPFEARHARLSGGETRIVPPWR